MGNRQVGGTRRELVILGVDSSLAATGWAVLHAESQDTCKVLACDTIKTKREMPLEDRLAIIYDKMTKIIADHDVEEMACENPFFNRNAKTFGTLSSVKGVVMLAAVQAGIPVALYQPSTVKARIAGQFRGRSDKDRVSAAVVAMTGCAEMADYDQSDAAAVAITHLLLRNAVCNDGPKQSRKSR